MSFADDYHHNDYHNHLTLKLIKYFPPFEYFSILKEELLEVTASFNRRLSSHSRAALKFSHD